MDLCCNILLSAIETAGKKGFAVIPTKGFDHQYRFVLQCRSKDNDPQAFIAQHYITYCPWCGTLLSSLIDLNKNEILELANNNEKLLI